MKLLFILFIEAAICVLTVLMPGCTGSEGSDCYNNYTCNPGLVCVHADHPDNQVWSKCAAPKNLMIGDGKRTVCPAPEPCPACATAVNCPAPEPCATVCPAPKPCEAPKPSELVKLCPVCAKSAAKPVADASADAPDGGVTGITITPPGVRGVWR